MSESPIRSTANEAWEDLLHQLHRQPKAQPRPFFYARVQARLAAQATAQRQLLPGWLHRPAYAALLGALVLSLTGDGPAGDSTAKATGASYLPQR